MPGRELPPIRFDKAAAAQWSQVLDSLGGLIVELCLVDDNTIRGELLGDGNGTQVRLLVAGEDHAFMARSVQSIKIL